MIGVVPAPVRALAQTDAPRVAVAAQAADGPPQAACIDDPAADLPVANWAVVADCIAAQAVMHRWSSALLAREAADGRHGRDLLRVRDRCRHP